MNITEPANLPEFKLHSVPVRIRYTGPHSLEHFHTSQTTTTTNETNKDQEDETITYIRGRKLTGAKLPLGNALLLRKEFDDLKVVGKIQAHESTWFEREGAQQVTPNRIAEMQKLAELIHG